MKLSELSEERRRYLRQKRRRKHAILACQLGLLIGFFVLWEVSARLGWIDSFILSQPSRMFDTYVSLFQTDLLTHIGVTVYETLAGFFLGVVLGMAVAVALWWSPFLSKVSEPYLVVLNSLPKIALGPVIIVIAGAGTSAIIFMALAISLVVTILEMLSGFHHTDSEYIRMARTFGATKAQIFM